MSANPTTVDWEAATITESGTPLQAGNRVLETIAQREALSSLLAFSDLHAQIQERRASKGRPSDHDMFETERFILDEVLQLICNRAETLTQADCVLVALLEGPDLVCRAASGALADGRGVQLIAASRALQECLGTGRAVRCDDCETDVRLHLDFSRVIGSRSTILVPLRGGREQLGVLQAFSTKPHAFTENDVRCLDLFSELVLSALKPEDQDRRIGWLSNVAAEVLEPKPPVSTSGPTAGTAALADANAITPVLSTGQYLPESSPAVERVSEIKVEQFAGVEESGEKEKSSSEFVQESAWKPVGQLTDDSSEELSSFSSANAHTQAPTEDDDFSLAPSFLSSRPLATNFDSSGGSRPGVGVVLTLVAAAALFSVASWWEMRIHQVQTHGPLAHAQKTEKTTAGSADRQIAASTRPAGPVPSAEISLDLSGNSSSDDLMNPATAGSADATTNKSFSKITGVRHWSSAIGSTVVIDMDDEVPYEVHRLASPERIYFDLHNTSLASDLDGETVNVDDASLTRVRVGQPITGVTRIVLDTKDGANFSVSMESSPYRLVVELRGSEKAQAANLASPGHTIVTADRVASNIPPVETTAPDHTVVVADRAPVITKTASIAPSNAASPGQVVQQVGPEIIPAKTAKFRIVLDAGHGGWDLGTVGQHGLLEKDLVLDVTRRLGKLLQSRLGSEVMFTRTDDTYLPLDQRADIANQRQADLFVSIHANYSTSTSARGVETYYTNLFSAPGSREVEKHEDGTFAKLMSVSLSPSTLHEKIADSQRLAASVQHSLYATLAAKSPDIRNRGIKDAAFLVLTGTTMPAILTEISFVSSPADERNLQSEAYRQQIAEALYQGIARYQQSSPAANSHSKIAQLRPGTSGR